MVAAHIVTCTFPHLHWWTQFLHPGQLRTPCGGYWFHSGIEGELTQITILFALYHLIRSRNCHVKGCKSILTHTDPKHGWPACRRHHSQADKLGRSHHPDDVL